MYKKLDRDLESFRGVVRPAREQDLEAIKRIVDEWHGDGEETAAYVREFLTGGREWSYLWPREITRS